MKVPIQSNYNKLSKSSSSNNFNSTARSKSSHWSQSTNYTASANATTRYSIKDLLVKNTSGMTTSYPKISTVNKSNNKDSVNQAKNIIVFGDDKTEDVKISKEIIKKLTAWDIEHIDDQDKTKQKYIWEMKSKGLLSNKPIESVNATMLLRNSQELKAKKLLKSKEKDANSSFLCKSHNGFNYDVFLNNNNNNSSNKKNVKKLNNGNGNDINKSNNVNVNEENGKEIENDNDIDNKNNKEELKIELEVEHDMNQPNYYNKLIREQMKIENDRREELKQIYNTLLILKLKKNKYQNIIDDAYTLLDEARLETALTLDLLNDRKNAANKRYEAFINSPINPEKELDEEQKLREYEAAMAEKAKNNRMHKRKKYRVILNDDGVQSTVVDSVMSIPSHYVEEFQKFKKRKKTLLEIYEEKMKIHQQYIEIIRDIEVKREKHTTQYASIQNELTAIIDKNKEEVELVNQEHFNYKVIFQSKSKDQKNYYLQVLQQGLDTRNEGLTWVIKRLLELNVSLENHNFPNYLDSDQIDYLLNISKLGFESYQLKVLLKTLKNRQKKIFEEQTKNRVNKINSYANQKEQEKMRTIGETEKKEPYIDKYQQKMKEICEKHETLFKSQIESKIEERHVSSIVRNIKERLFEYAITGKSFVNDKEDNVVKYMIENEKQKEFFTDIIALRQRIKDIEVLYRKMFKEQSQVFKQKFYFIKQKQNDKAASLYGTIYSALFGTNSIGMNEQDFL